MYIFLMIGLLFFLLTGKVSSVLASRALSQIPVLCGWSHGRVQHAPVHPQRVQSHRRQGKIGVGFLQVAGLKRAKGRKKKKKIRICSVTLNTAKLFIAIYSGALHFSLYLTFSSLLRLVLAADKLLFRNKTGWQINWSPRCSAQLVSRVPVGL